MQRTDAVVPFAPGQERVVYMGESRSVSVVLDRGTAPGRARCRKDRDRTVREVRATLDEVARLLAAAAPAPGDGGGGGAGGGDGGGGGGPGEKAADSAEAELSRSGIANAVRAARYAGGALVVSYLDGTSREPADIHRYNAHVREAMVAALTPHTAPAAAAAAAAEGESGGGGAAQRREAEALLPDAASFEPPVTADGELRATPGPKPPHLADDTATAAAATASPTSPSGKDGGGGGGWAAAATPRSPVGRLRAYNDRALRCAHALLGSDHPVLAGRDFAADFDPSRSPEQ